MVQSLYLKICGRHCGNGLFEINRSFAWFGDSNLRLHALTVVILIAGFVNSTKLEAYNVCSDPGAPCTHEVMTKQGLDLYLSYVESSGMLTPLAEEIRDSWDPLGSGILGIKAGVGNPDQFDPLYGNAGLEDALITITHFWSPDVSLGAPMDGLNTLGADDYPNAHQVALALWTRALGEYSAGNKIGAYQYLGMVAHFLGDQTIPTHSHNDTHGPDLLDDDAFEEWMSMTLGQVNGSIIQIGASPRAALAGPELDNLKSLGMLDIPQSEISDKLLWLFLSTNQRADYFASDDVNGDAIPPGDLRVLNWVSETLDSVQAACSNEPRRCPTNTAHLRDNDGLGIGNIFTDANNNDDDTDLSIIRRQSYVPGIRSIAALFALWEEAVKKPILTVTIHQIKEIGDYEGDCGILEICSGMDSILEPDFYVGMVLGSNRRSCGGSICPDPVGAYLEDRNGNIRIVNGEAFPSNVTRRDAFGVNEDKTVINPFYRFGQTYNYSEGVNEYTPSEDLVDITLSVWENDESAEITNDPYDSDDPADIFPGNGRILKLTVDLAKCTAGAASAVTVHGVNTYNCANSIALQGAGDDTDDVRVVFSVAMLGNPDASAPVVSCGVADDLWHKNDVSITCTSADEGVGLANPADASFQLSTNVLQGEETDNASTGTRNICDAVGNCTTAGPVDGNKVDKKAPVVSINEPTVRQYTHSETLVLNYTVTDGGSGVRSVTPTMNGETTVAGKDLLSGRSINLLTSLTLGENTFTVNADDNVNNISTPSTVVFTIIVTPQSIIDALNQFVQTRAISRNSVQPLLAKLRNAKKKWDQRQCTPAENIYHAFINHVQAQIDKSITPHAAQVLVIDAQYLIAHCQDSELIVEGTRTELNNPTTIAVLISTASSNSTTTSPLADEDGEDNTIDAESPTTQSDNKNQSSNETDSPGSGAGFVDGWILLIMLMVSLIARHNMFRKISTFL